MSDPSLRRQKPTDATLIANGDPDMALHMVDRLDAKIDRTTIGEVIDALRYWIGEADHWKEIGGPPRKVKLPQRYALVEPHDSRSGECEMEEKTNGPWLLRHDVIAALKAAGWEVDG